MSATVRSLILSGLLGLGLAAQAATASFEDLSSPPERDAVTGLFFANNDSLVYAGVTWDNRFRVVGDLNRIDAASPLYGIPHSGNYFVTNEGDGEVNDGLLITTDMVLTGAWFGRNAYYGFDAGGADMVTIHALAGDQVLLSLPFDLPDTDPGNPAPLLFFDTSQFAGLTGITAYRINRRELGEKNGNWVADDFTFVPASVVPEPAQAWMLLGGFALLAAALRRHRNPCR